MLRFRLTPMSGRDNAIHIFRHANEKKLVYIIFANPDCLFSLQIFKGQYCIRAVQLYCSDTAQTRKLALLTRSK